MLKRFSLLVVLLLSCSVLYLLAADFWVAKPFTEWTDKDVQKMLNASPWAQLVTIDRTTPARASAGGGGGGGGGGKGKGGGGGGGGGGAEGAGGSDTPNIQTTPVTLRWVTALPVKQAYMKQRFGAEAGTSAQAKQVLDQQEQFYVLSASLPTAAARGVQATKDELMLSSALNVKGKEALHPSDIQFSAPQGPLVSIFFRFPRSTTYTVDDKELEFSSKINGLNVKCKFKLKDLVFNNKLEL